MKSNVYFNTYIRKVVEVKGWFDVINNGLDDRKMQYKCCVINTTQWYPKFGTDNILYQTFKKDIIAQFSFWLNDAV